MLRWNLEKHPFCLKKFIGKESKSHKMGQPWALHSRTKIQVRRTEMGTGPMSFIINSPFSWARKFLLQLIKEKSQAANFFIINLLSCLSELIKLMYNFLKFFFLGIVIFFTIFFVKSYKSWAPNSGYNLQAQELVSKVSLVFILVYLVSFELYLFLLNTFWSSVYGRK